MIGSDVLSTVLQAITHGENGEGCRICATRLVPGATPVVATGFGFYSGVTRHAAGDYSMTFLTAFSTEPYPIVTVHDNAVAGSQVISGYVYSLEDDSIRVRFALDDGTLADPDYAYIFVIGV